MALLLLIVQTLILVPALALAGQGLIGAFNWPARFENPVYRVLGVVARPATGAIRSVTRNALSERRNSIVTFAVLLCAYLAVGLAHRDVCLLDLSQAGCERWAVARGAIR